MPDPVLSADDIALALSQIDDRLAQNPGADEKKKLLDTKQTLALQLSEIAEQDLDQGAIAVINAANKLKAVIASAGQLPFAKYFEKLTKAIANVEDAVSQRIHG